MSSRMSLSETLASPLHTLSRFPPSCMGSTIVAVVRLQSYVPLAKSCRVAKNTQLKSALRIGGTLRFGRTDLGAILGGAVEFDEFS